MRSVSRMHSLCTISLLAVSHSVNQPRHKGRDQRALRTILLLLCLLWRNTGLSNGASQPANSKKGSCSYESRSWAKSIVQEASNQASQPQSHSHVEPLHSTAG